MAQSKKRSGSRVQRRGFRALSERRRREIASMGGKAAHQKGTAHRFTSEEAKRAGRKGGRARSKAARLRR